MLREVNFERKFSRNLYKSERLMLSQMRFGELPLKTARGDIYPSLLSAGEFDEYCRGARYHFVPTANGGESVRLIGRFNPYSTYDIATEKLPRGSKFGVRITWKGGELRIFAVMKDTTAALFYRIGDKQQQFGECAFAEGMRLMVTFHMGRYIEVYTQCGDVIAHAADVTLAECDCLIEEAVFSSSDAALYVGGTSPITIAGVDNYLDCGIMQADIRPVKYENGEVLIENGTMYFTYSARFESHCMQQIMSYRLSTCEIKLIGAMLFDCGDGRWCDDVATSLICDRTASMWRIWMCAFSHVHVLGYGETANDPRFGINVIDVKPLDFVDSDLKFGGWKQDEDPDLYYDKSTGYWYLAICRSDPAVNKYRYYLFRSHRPDSGFEYVSRSDDSLEATGGSFVKFNNKIYFVFGRAFRETSKYDVCEFPSLRKLGELKCNHIDGGFRGWGSVFEIPCGTRKRLLWATFDRTLGGKNWGWSYGNLYFYESPTMKIE